MVNQLSKINFRNNYFISCDIFISKQLIQLRRKIFKGFFLLPIRRFHIYIHCGLDVLVPHDGLDHLKIALHLAEPGRKGMPEMMAGKFRKQHWLAAFPCSTETLIGVIAVHNPLNRAVYAGGIRQGTEAVLKNETRVSIHFLFITSVRVLLFPQDIQRIPNRIQKRDRADAGIGFGLVNMELRRPIFGGRVIGQAVVDADEIFLKVDVLPS